MEIDEILGSYPFLKNVSSEIMTEVHSHAVKGTLSAGSKFFAKYFTWIFGSCSDFCSDCKLSLQWKF